MRELEADIPVDSPLHENLAVCLETAREYQSALDEFTGPFEEKMQLANRFVDLLDEKFPLMNQPVYMSGNALVPIADEDGDIVGEGFKYLEGNAGIHQGFNNITWQDDEGVVYTKIAQQVFVGEKIEQKLMTVNSITQIYQYFDIDASLFSVQELESTLSSFVANPKNLEFDFTHEKIGRYSRELVNMLRSTGFRRKAHSRQLNAVEELSENVRKDLPLGDVSIKAKAQFAYAPLVLNPKVRHYMQIDLRETILHGTCLGIDTLVLHALKQKAIRRDNDNPFLFDGFCLVVDPSAEVREELNLTPKQNLYIPTYSQSFDAYLYAE